jgi:hypothetical protein
MTRRVPSPYFWHGVTEVYLGRDDAARTAVDQALALGLPPILLSPLRWLEQDRPEAYRAWAAPLLARYDLLPPTVPASAEALPPAQ